MTDPEPLDKLAATKPATMSDPKLARWLRGLWHTKKIARIELYRVAQGGREHVSTWDKDKLAGKEPDTFIQEIYTEAQEDALSFRGFQRYAVFFTEDGGQQPMRKFFVVKGSEWDEDSDDESGGEAATPKGHLAQMMRHNEALMRLAIGGAREGQIVMRGIVSDLVSQNKEYQSMHYKVMEIYGRLQDKAFDQEIEREDKKSMRNLKESAGAMLMAQAPTLLNLFASRMTTNDEKTQKDTEIKLMVSQFARSLTAEQMEAQLAFLSTEQRIVFMQLYNTLREEYLASAEGQAEMKRAQEAQAAAEEEARKAAAHVEQAKAEGAAAAEAAKQNPEAEVDSRSGVEGPIITPPPSETEGQKVREPEGQMAQTQTQSPELRSEPSPDDIERMRLAVLEYDRRRAEQTAIQESEPEGDVGDGGEE